MVEETRTFTVFSSILSPAGKAVFKISIGGCGTTGAVQSVLFYSEANSTLLSVDAVDATRIFRYSCDSCDLMRAETVPLRKLGYSHPALLGGQVLDTVWQQFGTVIAPKLGIVQFVKPETTDTFYLQRTNF